MFDFGILSSILGTVTGGLFGWLQKREDIKLQQMQMTHALNMKDKEVLILEKEAVINLQEAEANFKTLKMQSDAAVDQAEIQAITAGHQFDTASYFDKLSDKMVQKYPWMTRAMMIVDVVRGLIRPALTVGNNLASFIILGILMWMYWKILGSFSEPVVGLIQDNLFRNGTTPLMPQQYQVVGETLNYAKYATPEKLYQLLEYSVYSILYTANMATAWWFNTRPIKPGK